MKLRYRVEFDVDLVYIHLPGLPLGEGLKRVAQLANDCENALADAVSWKHGVVHGSVGAADRRSP